MARHLNSLAATHKAYLLPFNLIRISYTLGIFVAVRSTLCRWFMFCLVEGKCTSIKG